VPNPSEEQTAEQTGTGHTSTGHTGTGHTEQTGTGHTTTEQPDSGQPGTRHPAPGTAPNAPRSPVPLWPPPPPGWESHHPGNVHPGHAHEPSGGAAPNHERPPLRPRAGQEPNEERNPSGWQAPPGWGGPPRWPSDSPLNAPHPNAPYGAAGWPRFAQQLPVDSLGRPLASWIKRALAIAVDFLLLWFILSEIGHEAFPLVVSSSTSTHAPESQVLSFIGVSLLVWIGYLAFLASSRRGQTLGMMLYGIAVRDDSGGGQVSIWRATLRSAILIFASGFFVDLLWPLWDRKRQSLHDKAARTVVVDVRLAALLQQLQSGD
jgi:uncharacterized RDD family membrane protein YckC